MDPASPPAFSLRRRVQLCLVMLALESYISFEEIFMLAVLQRMEVPVLLVSMPGTISSAIGVFVIPLLGWASDRSTCCSKSCGQKRPFAFWTLAVSVTGVSLLLFLSTITLYSDPNYSNNTTDGIVQHNNVSVVTEQLGQVTDLGLEGHGQGRGPLPADDMSPGGYPPSFSSITTAVLAEQTPYTSTMTSNVDAPLLSTTSTSPLEVTHKFSLNLTAEGSSPEVDVTSDSSTTLLAPYTYRPSASITPGSTSDSGSSEYVAPLSLLGIVGFVLADHGYDSSISTFKAYMIAVTPVFQHESIFIMGTLIGAIGGCLTSLLGFVDLADFFPDTGAVLDKGMAQCLAQALLLLTELLVLGFVSLVTGSEDLQQPDSGDSGSSPSDCETVIDGSGNDLKKHNVTPPLPGSSNVENDFTLSEKTPLVTDPLSGSRGGLALIVIFWRRWKPRIFLCVMMFLGLSTNYSYFVYVSNYVAEVIYQGDPNAASGSPAYDNYVQGVHVASLGMLTFYVLFVVFNIFHQQIMAKIGMRAEYLSASVACAALMLTLALTDNIVVFFVNAVTMAMFRAAVYTVPFILSNNLAQQEAAERDGDAKASSGIAMATITAMIPGSYFVVSLVMGPLMDVTGNPGMPIFFALGSCLLGIVSSAFVRFG